MIDPIKTEENLMELRRMRVTLNDEVAVMRAAVAMLSGDIPSPNCYPPGTINEVRQEHAELVALLVKVRTRLEDLLTATTRLVS